MTFWINGCIDPVVLTTTRRRFYINLLTSLYTHLHTDFIKTRSYLDTHKLVHSHARVHMHTRTHTHTHTHIHTHTHTQGSAALAWLAKELLQAPPEIRAQALRLPGDLAGRVSLVCCHF